jgi:hypothetical protein
MKAIEVDTTGDRYLISIDRNLFTEEKLLRMLNQFRLEVVPHQSNLDQSFELFGEGVAKLNDEYLQECAQRGSREKFERALSKVKSVEPIEEDKL